MGLSLHEPRNTTSLSLATSLRGLSVRLLPCLLFVFLYGTFRGGLLVDVLDGASSVVADSFLSGFGMIGPIGELTLFSPTIVPVSVGVRDLGLTALVIVVAIFDGRFRRIPNRIVFPAMLVGSISHLGWPGELGRAAGIIGILVAFLLLLLPYVTGGMKAGDVKLLMAIGAFTGGWGVVEVLLVTLLCYPALALFAVVRERKGRLTWLRFRRVLCNFLGLFLPMLKWYAIRLDSLDDSSIPSVTTPFGVALAVGTLLTQYAVSLW